jgi:hypothetical protein
VAFRLGRLRRRPDRRDRRHRALRLAIVTATLLLCDAWFDVVLDWNSDDRTGSLLTAGLAELPMAALLLYVARKMIRLTVIIAWHRAGRTARGPPLSRLSLLILTAHQDHTASRGGHEGESR